MTWDPYSQNYNTKSSNRYTSGGYEKAKLIKIVLLIICVVVAVVIGVVVTNKPQNYSGQNKYIKSATTAAKKQIPHAKVSNVKVADGFALAIVSDPTSDSQAKSGNSSVFRVKDDGSMELLADASYFSPLDLLQLGIPLKTQAKLTNSTISQVRQNFANQCGYKGDSTPGYSGFDGLFNPDGWQIDSETLGGLEKALTQFINRQNTIAKPDEAIICVNAMQKDSNATDDLQTYISTFTLNIQFITSDGTITDHAFTFATGPNYYHKYTLDGNNL